MGISINEVVVEVDAAASLFSTLDHYQQVSQYG